jgi:hypothetical protein
MLLITFICLILIVAGSVWFLYGANVYNAVIGWSGIGVFTVGWVLIFVVNLSIYREKKKTSTSIMARKNDSKRGQKKDITSKGARQVKTV